MRCYFPTFFLTASVKGDFKSGDLPPATIGRLAIPNLSVFAGRHPGQFGGILSQNFPCHKTPSCPSWSRTFARTYQEAPTLC